MRFVALCCAVTVASFVALAVVVGTAAVVSAATGSNGEHQQQEGHQQHQHQRPQAHALSVPLTQAATGEEAKNAAKDVPVQQVRAPPASYDPFIPTDEWQEVKPGQAIPAGLHVSIDMQTGVKMAKNLSSEDKPESKVTLSEKRTAKLELAAQLLGTSNASSSSSSSVDDKRVRHLADALAAKWDKQPLPHQEQGIRLGRRVLKLMQDGDSTLALLRAPEPLIEALEDLEYTLHDGQVAIELSDDDGLLPILSEFFVDAVHTAASQTNMDLAGSRSSSSSRGDVPDASVVRRLLATLCLTLGTSMQNNAPVADKLASPAVSRAAASLLQHRGTAARTLHKRALYLLASMVRSRPVLVASWLYVADELQNTDTPTVFDIVASFHEHVLASKPVSAPLLRKTTTLLADAMTAEMRVSCPHLLDPKHSNDASEADADADGDSDGDDERAERVMRSANATAPSASAHDGPASVQGQQQQHAHPGSAATDTNRLSPEHELTKLEMAHMRASHAAECASVCIGSMEGKRVCEATVAAFVENDGDLAMQEALLELLSLLPCDWDATPPQTASTASSSSPSSSPSASSAAGDVLRARARVWTALASGRRDEAARIAASHGVRVGAAGAQDDDDDEAGREVYGYLAGLATLTAEQHAAGGGAV